MKRRTPSETALRIAGNFAAAATDPELRPLLADPDTPYWASFVRAHSWNARFRLFLWTFPPTRRLAYRLTEAVLPGSALYILARKRCVEDAVREALRDGATQAVSFGAGFDPLFLRLAGEFPGVRFFEIDHPDTQAVKQRALLTTGILPERLLLLSADFSRETAADRLQACADFDAGAVTVFVAEGVLMYLLSDAVTTVFQTVSRHGAPGSTLVFTVVEKEVLEDPSSIVARAAVGLKRMGEPILSSHSRRNLDSELRRHGFRRAAVMDNVLLKNKYLTPLKMDRDLIAGELIVTARRQ